MSVHKRNDGWRVIWREGGKQRSKQFDRKGDADAFECEIRRRRQLGPALVDQLIEPNQASNGVSVQLHIDDSTLERFADLVAERLRGA